MRSTEACEVCGKVNGFAYSGGFSGEPQTERICPWCIADGSAHQKFAVEFVDRDSAGGGEWEQLSPEIADEVVFRTPGFCGWQQERWFAHCGDAAQFLGPMGKEQLQTEGAEAIEVIRSESGLGPQDWELFYKSLNAEHGPATAYLFKCRHCGKLGGYSDCV